MPSPLREQLEEIRDDFERLRSQIETERVRQLAVAHEVSGESPLTGSAPGGVTINLSSSPDTLLVTIKSSGGTSMFNQEATSFDSTLRLPIDTYSVRVENPGFFCSGANDQVSGSIDFWHEQTNIVA